MSQVTALNAAVKHSIEIANSTTLFQRIKMILVKPVNRRALSTSFQIQLSAQLFHLRERGCIVVSCGLQAQQQLSGFNTLMYYSATLFKSIGFDKPIAVGLIVSGTNFVFTLFALKYIDIVGRRKIMIWSAPGMVVGLTLASIAFHCELTVSGTRCILI